jgi:hypothetical protein
MRVLDAGTRGRKTHVRSVNAHYERNCLKAIPAGAMAGVSDDGGGRRFCVLAHSCRAAGGGVSLTRSTSRSAPAARRCWRDCGL